MLILVIGLILKNYSIYKTDFPLTISGTLNDLSSANKVFINAHLVLNTAYEQNYLINKNMKLSIKAKSFSCKAKEKETEQQVMTLSGLAADLVENMSSDELWKSPLEEDGYRFVGENPNNYVCFGTSDQSECLIGSNQYMYRIIGIFADDENNGHIKLVKSDPLNTEYQWHSNGGGNATWGESDLYNGINGEYFLTSYYDSLYNDYITNWNYTVTDADGIYYQEMTSKEIYLYELNRAGKSNTYGTWSTLNDKIGLMYYSDYVLSLGENYLNDFVLDSGYSNAIKTSWLNINNDEWTMAFAGGQAGVILSDGSFSFNSTDSLASVRPVFYLNSDVVLLNGYGTEEYPFMISLS